MSLARGDELAPALPIAKPRLQSRGGESSPAVGLDRQIRTTVTLLTWFANGATRA